VKTEGSSYWFSRHSKLVIFLIVVLALLGGYLAWTIPVSVFPATNFPHVLIAVDNGVMPIDQMMVTVTRPIDVKQRARARTSPLHNQPGFGGNRSLL
jgi:multidrug efflux pump subunit AcrB